ncbi:hypothetical protein KPH14_004845 [Odynerus spinipes]|uniref:Uncharacterized protein n=1 Tax=Odynerus spinipes TaxID=1348599 RepID=A0AAD9RMM8_9HYME|nr:hypothetical protein KPH14_004845 [Odynerus spinipes]
MFIYISLLVLSLLTATSVRPMPVDQSIDEFKNEIVESTTRKLRDRWVIFFYDKDFVPSISLLPDSKTFKQDGEARIDTRLDWEPRNLTRGTLLASLLRSVQSSTTGTTATAIIGKLIEQLRNIGSKFIESLDVERFWNLNGTRFENLSNKTEEFSGGPGSKKLTLIL